MKDYLLTHLIQTKNKTKTNTKKKKNKNKRDEKYQVFLKAHNIVCSRMFETLTG